MPRWPDVPMSDRFWTKVHRTETCWEWTASRSYKGYGQFYVSPKQRRVAAHRVAYEMLVGPIPPGLVIDHLCRNRGCVNPDHMEVVTAVINTTRGVRALQTRCLRGHLLDGDNLARHTATGSRVCRTCNRDYQREWARRKRGARPKR